jgi:G-2 and S-phase expressed 1
VFFGPVGHTEKCVAVAVNEVAKVNEKLRPLSPLTASEMAELCREACTIASRIEIAAGPEREKERINIADSNPLTSTEPRISNSPLDDLKNSLVAALPTAELPRDENGLVKFTAAGKQLPKLAKPVIRRGTGSSQIGSGLLRPTAKSQVNRHDHFNSNQGSIITF